MIQLLQSRDGARIRNTANKEARGEGLRKLSQDTTEMSKGLGQT